MKRTKNQDGLFLVPEGRFHPTGEIPKPPMLFADP